MYLTEPCIEGSVTLVGENSLQLVERCSNGGKWSPMCDYNWSLQDAIVVCRELGYQGLTICTKYSIAACVN